MNTSTTRAAPKLRTHRSLVGGDGGLSRVRCFGGAFSLIILRPGYIICQNMNKYSQGKIYRLYNVVDDSVYIGSTIVPLSSRLAKHKYYCGKKSFPVYLHLLNIGWQYVRCELVENFPCSSRVELCRRERYYYDLMRPSLNTHKPIVTHEEIVEAKRVYDAAHREQRKAYMRRWYAEKRVARLQNTT